jgi:ABC-type dipeptide/oligopeptide/nickel transport system permease component
VERFFSVPGMCPFLTEAVNRYDPPLVQALVLIYAALGILSVFFGDILMTIFDPRITLVKRGESR